MKIRKPTEENQAKVYALLRRAFPRSEYEATLVERLHDNDRPVQEWVCLHINKVIAYIAFTNAYNGEDICGLHLAPMAVAPDFQKQGVGSELLRFALRQEPIRSQTLFVLGEPDYYKKFGFEPCRIPLCPFDRDNKHFLSLRNTAASSFTVGYEAEFLASSKPSVSPKKKRR